MPGNDDKDLNESRDYEIIEEAEGRELEVMIKKGVSDDFSLCF